ncbi:protein prenyltransferase alpha subunit repeat-containing protein 1 [Synchiropus picturatus]
MAESVEEMDVLVQRVVKDITNALKKNPNIDEIGVIPCPEARYNRSPIILVENKLGVESWCVKFLLPYVHNKLLLYRQRKHWLDREALVDITCTALMLNPDLTTAWNVRKELLQCGALNPEKDLYLGKLALTKFPKSPETWIHRRWVLQHVLRCCSAADGRKQRHAEAEPENAENSAQLSEQMMRTLHQEMKVCCDAACRYPSNYNAWSHRIWVLQHMAKGNVKVFLNELSSTRLWVSMHVSDHSGFHYRQYLLQELVSVQCQNHGWASEELPAPEAAGQEERQDGRAHVLQLFHQEMELCSDLIQSYPGHEALWSHRRHVFFLWHQWRREHQDSSSNGYNDSIHLKDTQNGSTSGSDCVEKVNGMKHISEAMELDATTPANLHDNKRLKRGLLPADPFSRSFEKHFVSETLDSCCNPEQRRFALAYSKWLDMVLGQEP